METTEITMKAKQYGGPVNLNTKGGGPNGEKGHSNSEGFSVEKTKEYTTEQLLEAADKVAGSYPSKKYVRKKF
jgi:hypothetical protein